MAQPELVVEEEQQQPAETYPVAVGDVVGGRFRVDRYIGIGAMGLVVEAMHLELQQRVAIKFLREAASTNPDTVLRFAREARAAARLKSEHVVHVMDVGEMNGKPYLVMEYLDGANLDDRVATQGPFTMVQAVHLAIQMCEALAEAHSLGIVHRDIKPANICVITRNAHPVAKLLDFGISKAAVTGEYSDMVVDAKTTTIMGSPYYMAPEQVRSTKDVDARADIWALGAVLFELISGSPVWRSEELGKLVPEILSSVPRKLSELRPNIDKNLEAVLAGALESNVERRYQTAADFATALLPFAPPSARVNVDRATSFRIHAGASALPTLRQSSRDLAPPKSNPSLASTVPDTDGDLSPLRSKSTLIALGILLFALGGIGVLVLPRLVSGGSSSPVATSPVKVEAPPPSVSTTTAAQPPPPASPTVAATNPPTGTSHPAPPPTFQPAPRFGGGGGGFGGGRPQPTPKTTPTKPDTPAEPAPPGPAPKPAGSNALEADPWKRNQPKLDDNPFK